MAHTVSLLFSEVSLISAQPWLTIMPTAQGICADLARGAKPQPQPGAAEAEQPRRKGRKAKRGGRRVCSRPATQEGLHSGPACGTAPNPAPHAAVFPPWSCPAASLWWPPQQ